jgi:hypothetical protein
MGSIVEDSWRPSPRSSRGAKGRLAWRLYRKLAMLQRRGLVNVEDGVVRAQEWPNRTSGRCRLSYAAVGTEAVSGASRRRQSWRWARCRRASLRSEVPDGPVADP